MSVNLRSALIVSSISLLALVTLLFGVSRHIGGSNRRYMEEVVVRGLRQFYSDLKDKTAASGPSKAILSTADLRSVLLTGERYKRYFPSFVTQKDIFLATPHIALGNTNFVCMVRLNLETLWGINGAGESGRASDSQFGRWSHVGLDTE